MRVGFNTSYFMLHSNQMNTQSKLLDITKQLSSGKKIQFASEGSSIFSRSLRLDYEETTLTQAKKASENAKKYSDNTDTAITAMVTAMDRFKTLLVQAGSEIHSETSIKAIANDMKAIKNNLISLANTSVGGQFIFSGTAVSTKPINEEGIYQGNDQPLQALVGSNNLLTYNITGAELFLGSDDNKNRILTTNVKHYNLEKLYPNSMDPLAKGEVGEKVFITEDDPLRALVGDSNNNTQDDPEEFFYISGTRSDGTGFTEKFSLSTAYVDKSSATKVRDLLDRIGVAFGNTSYNKVVDVKLNEWGQIEIKDLNKGISKINFHMVSSPADVTDIDALIATGARVTQYVKSNYYSLPTSSSAKAVQNDFDHRIFQIPSVLKRNDNTFASVNDQLSDIFPVGTQNISLSGDRVNGGGSVPPFTLPVAGSTVQDLLTAIKQNFSAVGAPNYEDIDVELTNGKIYITDNTVVQLQTDLQDPPYDGPSTFSLVITGEDASSNPINIFSNSYSAEVDKVRFEKSGSKLQANTSQVITSNNEYATQSTRLIEVSSPQNIDGSFEYSLDGRTIQMDIEDVNGEPYHIEINLSNSGTTYNITDRSTLVRYPPLPNDYQLFMNYDSTVSTKADDMTYEQLTNIIEIGLNFSNLVAMGDTPIVGNTAAAVEAYKRAIQSSQISTDVYLDYKGRLTVSDKTLGESKINVSIYDDRNSDFSTSAPNNEFARLSFHENNSLTIDDPHVDFFDSINKAIYAVENMIYRPDGYNDAEDYDYDPRNIGIQNSLTVFDHLLDHVNKVHAKNGSQGNAFMYSIERNEIMIVQAKSLKSSILDADIAEVSMQYSQLTLNYQAMLSTVGKLSKLSLVNYV